MDYFYSTFIIPLAVALTVMSLVLTRVREAQLKKKRLQEAENRRLAYEEDKRIQEQRLIEAIGVPAEALTRINISYTRHLIPKKTGGSRKIYAPNDELKQIQRNILNSILYEQSAHPYSYGFRKHRSVVDNARPHCNSSVVIKLDIENFFPSIKQKSIEKVFADLGWSLEHSYLLAKLCCWQGQLPQGAPSSPALSNIYLKELDERLAILAIRLGARYSRYADDMTFSLRKDERNVVGLIIKSVQSQLASMNLRLNMKKQKIRVLRRHQHQEVCGITVNTDKPTLSRQKRRLLRAVKHRLDNHLPASMSREQLGGWESYNRMVSENPQ